MKFPRCSHVIVLVALIALPLVVNVIGIAIPENRLLEVKDLGESDHSQNNHREELAKKIAALGGVGISAVCILSETNVTDEDLSVLEGSEFLELKLRSTRISDRGLGSVAKIPWLGTLELDETNITDVGMLELTKMGQLQYLSLKHTKVTDNGLPNVARIDNLIWLNLADTTVTDGGLQHLGSLKKLRFLILDSTRISGIGFKQLRNEDLRNISLNHSHLSDEGCSGFEGMPALISLQLSYTSISDEGVKTLLKAVPNLRGLCLDGTKISNASLKLLCQFEKLDMLSIKNNPIDDDGLRQYVPKTTSLIRIDLRETKTSKEGRAEFERRMRTHNPKFSLVTSGT